MTAMRMGGSLRWLTIALVGAGLAAGALLLWDSSSAPKALVLPRVDVASVTLLALPIAREARNAVKP